MWENGILGPQVYGDRRGARHRHRFLDKGVQPSPRSLLDHIRRPNCGGNQSNLHLIRSSSTGRGMVRGQRSQSSLRHRCLRQSGKEVSLCAINPNNGISGIKFTFALWISISWSFLPRFLSLSRIDFFRQVDEDTSNCIQKSRRMVLFFKFFLKSWRIVLKKI